ncbi:MAG TPA: hypothetical protein VD931_05030 [Baekduia sp.]|nr:hypothetical protein [Baekduia sp.]
MTPQPEPNHYVRRVVLPSGKTIEVVYFDERPAATAPTSEPRPEPRELHICRSCESDLVHPTEWEEAGPLHWEVTLRCPNCEWVWTGIYEQEHVERFDEELDRGTEALVRDLRRLSQANMEDEIDRFVHALTADQILPDDF